MDIVERLRGAYSTVFERSLAKESADEIERLRKSQDELRRIRELCIKALCAVTGASRDAIESAPLTEALKAKARAERAEAELAAARRDAERYRWLRERIPYNFRVNSAGYRLGIVFDPDTPQRIKNKEWMMRNERLDAAIDAARVAQNSAR